MRSAVPPVPPPSPLAPLSDPTPPLHPLTKRACSSYLSLARFNAKFERAYVEQAREDVQWERRQKECLDGERDLMKGVKGWVVGSRRFFTQWEDKPDKDVLDPRVRALPPPPPFPPACDRARLPLYTRLLTPHSLLPCNSLLTAQRIGPW